MRIKSHNCRRDNGSSPLEGSSKNRTSEFPTIAVATESLRFMPPLKVDALCCVHYAEYLANTTGYALHDWRIEAHIEPEIVERVGIDSADIPDILELVSNHTKDFVKAA